MNQPCCTQECRAEITSSTAIRNTTVQVTDGRVLNQRSIGADGASTTNSEHDPIDICIFCDSSNRAGYSSGGSYGTVRIDGSCVAATLITVSRWLHLRC